MPLSDETKDALRQCVYFQLKLWDALRAVELSLGCEFSDLDDEVRNWASSFEAPEHALELTDKDLKELINRTHYQRIKPCRKNKKLKN